MEPDTQELMPRAAVLCQTYGICAEKRLGQNFLDRPAAAYAIAAAFPLREGDRVLEIGPGLGALSRALLAAGVWLHALEIDPRLLPVLDDLQASWPRFSFELTDARGKDWQDYLPAAAKQSLSGATEQSSGSAFYVYGNLPYNLSSAFLKKAVCEASEAQGMAFLLQREAVARFRARPGEHSFGPLQILCQLYGESRRGLRIPAAAFYPAPHVDSEVLILAPSAAAFPAQLAWRKAQPKERRDFAAFLEKAFRMRRKTLRNNLQSLWMESGGKLAGRAVRTKGKTANKPLPEVSAGARTSAAAGAAVALETVLQSLPDPLGAVLEQRPEQLDATQWWELWQYLRDWGQIPGESQGGEEQSDE